MYMLQHGSLFVTSFVFLMGLLFKVNGVSIGSTTYNALSDIMLGLCAAFISFWLIIVVLQVVRRLPELWRRRLTTAIQTTGKPRLPTVTCAEYFEVLLVLGCVYRFCIWEDVHALDGHCTRLVDCLRRCARRGAQASYVCFAHLYGVIVSECGVQFQAGVDTGSGGGDN